MGAVVVALLGLCLIAFDQFTKQGCNWKFGLAVGLVGLALGLTSWFYEHKENRRDYFKKAKGPLNSSILAVPTTIILAFSMATACPAAEMQAQAPTPTQVRSHAFKLLSPGTGYVLTPVKGGSPISFDNDCVSVDAANGLILTPNGKYKIISVSDNENTAILQGEDGTQYIANVGLLCIAVIGAAIVAIVYFGGKGCSCAKKVVSNYVNQVSNAANIVLPSIRVKSKVLPLLSTLVVPVGATHVMGPPPQIFKLPAGSSIRLANMNSNSFYADTNVLDGVLESSPIDIFGNTVNVRQLTIITSTNSVLVDSNGQVFAAPLQRSSDLINWSDITQVSYGYACISEELSPRPLSLTTVTMTPDLRIRYATNWIRFGEDGEVVESYSVASPIGGPMTKDHEYFRLKLP